MFPKLQNPTLLTKTTCVSNNLYHNRPKFNSTTTSKFNYTTTPKFTEVLFSPVIIESGEQLLHINNKGKASYHNGPQRKFLSGKYCKLNRHTVFKDEYIRIQYTDGTIKHISGPTLIFECPIIMKSIEIKPKIILGIDQVIKIKKEKEESFETLIGPQVYTPEPFDIILQDSYIQTLNNVQYAIVLYKSGEKELVAGPTKLLVDYTTIKNVAIKEAINIPENKTYLVTSPSQKTMCCINGPCIYIPKHPDDTCEEIPTYTIKETQYAKALYFSGKSEIISGPGIFTKNPYVVKSFEICNKINLNNNESMLIEGCFGDESVSRVISGPATFIPKNYDDKMTMLESYIANEKEYLKIEYLDGTTEIRNGPCKLDLNPVTMKSVKKENVIVLNDHQVIVVYRANKREIIKGIDHHFYYPQPDDILHEFSWHGSVDGGTRKVPNALKFYKLSTGPHQLYYNVEGVRTKDDALLTVKFMLFYEINSVESMLNKTNDPIASFINGITADIVSYASSRTFETFKKDTNILNDFEYFPNLVKCADNIGFTIKQIVFRGIEASKELEEMCTESLNKRTAMLIEEETRSQKEKMKNFELENTIKRNEQSRADELSAIKDDIEKNKLKSESNLQIKQSEHEFEIRKKTELAYIENNKNSDYYKLLKNYGVDINELLIMPLKNIKHDKHISIQGGNVMPVIYEDVKCLKE